MKSKLNYLKLLIKKTFIETLLYLIYLTVVLVIKFYSPEITEYKKENKESIKDNLTLSFLYQYFKGEVLTDEVVEFRIRLIYTYSLIFIKINFFINPTVYPIVGQAIFPSAATLIEKSILNRLDFQPNHKELLPNLSEGGNDEITLNFLGPGPFDRKNSGQILFSGNSAKTVAFKPIPSLNKMAHLLNSNYTQFEADKELRHLSEKFDTKNDFFKKFIELAKNPKQGVIDPESIDEARSIYQAQLKKLVIEPTRLDKETAQRVDLDFKVQGPPPFTHFDVKISLGSLILRRRN